MARTVLHQAAVHGSVRDVIDEGFDVNEPDADGLTPLHMACINWNIAGAKELLSSGAQVNLQDKWGNTPLLRAVGNHESSLDLVTLLLGYGADPTIANNYGHSPLSIARRLQGTAHLVPVLESAATTIERPQT